MRPAKMPANPHGVSFSRAKDIVKTIENLVAVKLTTKITEKSAVIFTLVFRPVQVFPALPPVRCQIPVTAPDSLHQPFCSNEPIKCRELTAPKRSH